MHVVISISTLPKHLGRIPFETGPYLIGNLIYNLIRWKLVPQKLKNAFTASDERWHVHSVGMYIALPQQTRIGFVRCRSVLCVKKKALLQEVVRNVCCMQRVFLRTTLKAACEPHCLSLVATSNSLSLCANMMSSIKPEIRNVSLCRQKRTKPWP